MTQNQNQKEAIRYQKFVNQNGEVSFERQQESESNYHDKNDKVDLLDIVLKSDNDQEQPDGQQSVPLNTAKTTSFEQNDARYVHQANFESKDLATPPSKNKMLHTPEQMAKKKANGDDGECKDSGDQCHCCLKDENGFYNQLLKNR